MSAWDLDQPVSRLMTAELWTVSPEQPACAVAQILAEHPVHHVPVVDGQRLVGLVSTSDMLRAGYDWTGARHRQPDPRLSVGHVMQARPVTVKLEATVRDVAELLCEGQFHAVPVVGELDRLAGLVTTTDLILWLLGRKATPFP